MLFLQPRIARRSISFLTFFTAMLLACTAMLCGCRSVPEITEIDPDLSPEELFQLAQEAFADEGNYKAAIVYYQAFLERFPDNISRAVEAEYEIAFIYYKQEKYTESKERLEELLSRYEKEGVEALPGWPRILAEKVLEKIEEETSTRRSRKAKEAEAGIQEEE